MKSLYRIHVGRAGTYLMPGQLPPVAVPPIAKAIRGLVDLRRCAGEPVRAASAACTRFVEATRRGMERVFDPARVGVLRLAVERGPIRPTELARELGVNPSSITRQVKALHALGHVAVSADPKDGRAFLVKATKRGRAELRSFDAVGLEVFAAVVEEWSEEDLLLLATLLDRMVETWASRAEDKRQVVHEHAGVPRSADPWWADS